MLAEYKIWLEFGALLATLAAAWATTRFQVAALGRNFEVLQAAVNQLEKAGADRALAAAEALHRRVDELDKSIVRLQSDGIRFSERLETHAKHIEQAMARIEASLNSLQARLEAIASRRSSRDEKTP